MRTPNFSFVYTMCLIREFFVGVALSMTYISENVLLQYNRSDHDIGSFSSRGNRVKAQLKHGALVTGTL